MNWLFDAMSAGTDSQQRSDDQFASASLAPAWDAADSDKAASAAASSGREEIEGFLSLQSPVYVPEGRGTIFAPEGEIDVVEEYAVPSPGPAEPSDRDESADEASSAVAMEADLDSRTAELLRSAVAADTASVPDALSASEWAALRQPDGSYRKDEVMARIYKSGVAPAIRRDVWAYLLGYKQWDESDAEARVRLDDLCEEYETYKRQYLSITPRQADNFAAFREARSTIGRLFSVHSLLCLHVQCGR